MWKVCEMSFNNGVFLLQSKGCHSSAEEETEWKQKLQRGHAGSNGEWRQAGMPQKGRSLFFCHFVFPDILLNVHILLLNSHYSALFSSVASTLSWGEVLEALLSIFLTQLISAFVWALIHPKYWQRKVIAQMSPYPLGLYYPLPTMSGCSFTPNCGHICKWKIWHLPYFQLPK